MAPFQGIPRPVRNGLHNPYTPNGPAAVPIPGEGYRYVTRDDDGHATLNQAFIRALENLAENALTSRSDWLKKLGDPRRDIDDECGYPRGDGGQVSLRELSVMYDREPVAARVVECMPKESWQVHPSIYEDEDEANVTAFEQAWDDLGKSLAANGGLSWYQDEEGSPVWNYLERADILSRIGSFGVLFMGFDDGLDLSVPVPGSVEVPDGWEGEVTTPESGLDSANPASALKGPRAKRKRAKADSPATNAELAALNALPNLTTNERKVINFLSAQALAHEAVTNRVATPKEVLDGSWYQKQLGADAQYFGAFSAVPEVPATTAKKSDLKLLFLRAFDESLVQIVRYEADVTNPRFGQPVMYRVTFNDPKTGAGQGVGLPLATVFVHWTRVIHIADVSHHARSSEIFAAPAQLPVFNRLLDLRKTSGAAGEGYFRGGTPGLILETPPQMGADPIIQGGDQSIRDAAENFQNGFQKILRLTALTAKIVAPSVADPSPFVAAFIEQICIKLQIPVRVFKGAERGELASSQDDASWNDRVKHRQHSYITPRIICPFVDRLILVGVLPEPDFVPEPKEDPAMALDLPPSDAEQKEQETAVDAADVAKKPGAPPAKPKKVVPGRVPGESPVPGATTNAAPVPAEPKMDRPANDDPTSPQDDDGDASEQVRPVGYRVHWPDLDSNTEKEKAEIANTRVTAIAAYVSGGVDAMIPPLDFLTKIMQFDVLEAKEMLAAADAAAKQAQEEAKALAEEHGLVPEVPGYKDPEAVELPEPLKPGEEPKDSWNPNKPPATNAARLAWLNSLIEYERAANNVFCATGEGGGVDPTCRRSSNPDRARAGNDQIIKAAEMRGASKFVIRTADETDVLGSVAYTDSTRGWKEIHHLGSDGTTKGVGRRLVEYVARKAARSGGGIELDAIHDSYGFYEKLGFVPAGQGQQGRRMRLSPAATKKMARESVKKFKASRPPTANQFCPTGKGGGIDPTCPSGDGSGGKAGGTTGKTPNAAELESANQGKRLHPGVTVKTDKGGTEWVVKDRKGKKAGVENEALAAELARTAGVAVLPVHPQKHNGGDVAVSERVAGATPLSQMSAADRRAALSKVPKAELDRQALFDYAIGSGDPNMGNYMITRGGKFIALDKEQSLGYGQGRGRNADYHPPMFLEAAVQQGHAASHYEFDRRNLTDMASSANRMADELAARGKRAEAEGVRRRAEVLSRVAAGDRAPTAGELDRVGREYDRTNPAASGLGGWLRGLVGNEMTDNVFCPTGEGGGVDPTCSPDRPSVETVKMTVTYGTEKQRKTGEVEVHKNPTREHLTGLMKKLDLDNVSLKGMIDFDGNSYVWEIPRGAEGADHERMAAKLDKYVPHNMRFYVQEFDADGSPVILTKMGVGASAAVASWAGNRGMTVNSQEDDDWTGAYAEALLTVFGDGFDPGLLPDVPTANYDPSQPRDKLGRFTSTGTAAEAGKFARTLIDVHKVTGLNEAGTRRLVDELSKMTVADLRALAREHGGTASGALKADKVQSLSELIAAKYGTARHNPNKVTVETKPMTSPGRDTPVELRRNPAQTDIWRGWVEAKSRSREVAKQFLTDVADKAGSRELRSLAMDNAVDLAKNPGGKGTDLAWDGEIIRRILAKSHPET